MSRKNLKALIVLAMGGGLLFACQSGAKQAQADTSSVDSVKVESTVGTADIPYSLVERYFVKNTVKSLESPKIATPEAFDNVFGAAAVMGEGGRPTVIDFSKQYVIAVVLPETEYATTLSPVSLQKNENGEVQFTYKVAKGEKQTYTQRPCLAILVDNSQEGNVVLKEVE